MALMAPLTRFTGLLKPADLNFGRILLRTVSYTNESGYGNPYATHIRRRRVIEDASMPNFEKVECLKWTNWKMLRDVKRRHINSIHWQSRTNLKCIAKCETLPGIVREIALDDRNSLPRDSAVIRLNNRCAITSRPRGKLINWRLSRLVWRDMADHGNMSGAMIAKWG